MQSVVHDARRSTSRRVGRSKSTATWTPKLANLGRQASAAVLLIIFAALDVEGFLPDFASVGPVLVATWVAIGLAALGLILHHLGGAGLSVLARQHWLLLALAGLILLSTLWSVEPALSAAREVHFVACLLAGLAVGSVLQPRTIMSVLFWALSILLALNLLALLLPAAAEAEAGFWRGVTPDHDLLGYATASAALVLLAGLLGRRIHPLPGTILLGAAVVALFMSSVGQGLIALAAGGAAIGIRRARRSLEQRPQRVGALVLGLGAAAALLGIALGAVPSLQGSGVAAPDAARIVEAHPLGGLGYGTVWATQDEAWLPEVLVARNGGEVGNGLFQVAAELGLPLALFVFLFLLLELLHAVKAYVARPSPFALFALGFVLLTVLWTILSGRLLLATGAPWLLVAAVSAAVRRVEVPATLPRTSEAKAAQREGRSGASAAIRSAISALVERRNPSRSSRRSRSQPSSALHPESSRASVLPWDPMLWMLLLTLTVFMFSPPELPGPPLDRLALALLVVTVGVMAAVRRQNPFAWHPLLLPLLGLLAAMVLAAPDFTVGSQTWSFIAAKAVVPIIMFLAARHIFVDDTHRRALFVFSAAALLYLNYIAIAHLLDAHAWMFPKYIGDPAIGGQTNRARGPFLTAIANGISINMLAIMTIYWLSRLALPRAVLVPVIVATSLAIVATLTRAVWLSFMVSALALCAFGGNRDLRRVGVWLVTLGIACAALLVLFTDAQEIITQRFQAEGPVDVRERLYTAAFEMWQQRPVFGWGTNQMAVWSPHFMPGEYGGELLAAHNSFLEVVVEHGMVGLGLYVWLWVCLFRIGRSLPIVQSIRSSFQLDRSFLICWWLILAAYLINAMFVVVNYQFVNALLFTIAGAVVAQEDAVSRVPEGSRRRSSRRSSRRRRSAPEARTGAGPAPGSAAWIGA